MDETEVVSPHNGPRNLCGSERFQVKISGTWSDYGPKEDEVLKQAFDKFVRVANEATWNKHEHREAFKELVIKGRRYVVDFQKMVQVRKDNKKDYKVRPPMQLMGVSKDNTDEWQRGQGDLPLTCEACQRVYTLRHAASISDDLDWADCHWCQSCWRPFLEKEDKKNEKNQQSRVQTPAKHATPTKEWCSALTFGSKVQDQSREPLKKPTELLMNSEKCTLCNRGFCDNDLIYLNVYNRPSMVCHESCFKLCATPITLSDFNDGFVSSRDVPALEAQVFAY